MLEYYAVRCCECGMFQCTQKKKVPKFKCKVCGLNQSILKIYAQSYKAKDIRPIVQEYNLNEGTKREERKMEELNREESPPPTDWNEEYYQDKPKKNETNIWENFLFSDNPGDDVEDFSQGGNCNDDGRYTTESNKYYSYQRKRGQNRSYNGSKVEDSKVTTKVERTQRYQPYLKNSANKSNNDNTKSRANYEVKKSDYEEEDFQNDDDTSNFFVNRNVNNNNNNMNNNMNNMNNNYLNTVNNNTKTQTQKLQNTVHKNTPPKSKNASVPPSNSIWGQFIRNDESDAEEIDDGE